jgi:hypothetical protein
MVNDLCDATYGCRTRLFVRLFAGCQLLLLAVCQAIIITVLILKLVPDGKCFARCNERLPRRPIFMLYDIVKVCANYILVVFVLKMCDPLM